MKDKYSKVSEWCFKNTCLKNSLTLNEDGQIYIIKNCDGGIITWMTINELQDLRKNIIQDKWDKYRALKLKKNLTLETDKVISSKNQQVKRKM